MDNQTIQLIINDIVKLVIAGVFAYGAKVLVPIAKNVLLTIEEKAQQELGQQIYEIIYDFILNEYKLNKDKFTADKIEAFINEIAIKFENKISNKTIRKIVDLILKDAEESINADVKPVEPVVVPVTPVEAETK